jgi:TatD DNase family protein
VNEALQEGVSHLITVGTDLPSIPLVTELSAQFPNVFHTVGIHPHDAASIEDADLETVRQASLNPKCRAIGEIGLDTHYDHSPLSTQIKRLREQLDLALERHLPVVVHSREAEPELLEALRLYAAQAASDRAPGVIHCFTGSESFGKACLDLGFLISFSGILTFKNAETLRETAKKFPLDRLLVETDSPYLAPVPFRGKKCEPRMVKQTGLFLADLLNKDPIEVAQVTSQNALRLFAIA